MTKEDILKLRDHCEVTKVQFKERITDKYDVGCEMVAFCNSHGGQLVIGINDKTGVMNPLSYQEVQETTNMLSNMASENVIPSILLDVDTCSDTKKKYAQIMEINEGLGLGLIVEIG